MNYSYRRKEVSLYDVIRTRDNKVVAVFIRGAYHKWFILSADSDRYIAGPIQLLENVKKEFETYAKRRRGHI